MVEYQTLYKEGVFFGIRIRTTHVLLKMRVSTQGKDVFGILWWRVYRVLSGACPACLRRQRAVHDVNVQCTMPRTLLFVFCTFLDSSRTSSHKMCTACCQAGRLGDGTLDTRITTARTLPETLRECVGATQEWNLVASVQLLAYQIAPPVMERSCPAMPFAPSLHR